MKLWFKRSSPHVSSSASLSDEPSLEGAAELDDLGVAQEGDGSMETVVAVMDPAAAADDGRLRVVPKTGTASQPYLSDHKSLYKELLRGMYDAVLVADPKGHIIDANARVSELLFYSTADLWDMPIDEIIRGVSLQVLERIRKNVADQRYVLLDANCRRRDGSSFPAEVAISRLNLINDGDIVFCVRNVERRRKAQQRLRSQHNAIMNATTAVAICDLDGNMNFVNPAMAEMWSAGKTHDLLEQNVRNLWQTPAGIEKALGLALSGDRWIGPLPAQGIQGRRFMVEAMIAPDRDLRNEIIGVLCSFNEIAGEAV